MKDEDLPEDMRKMTLEERKAHRAMRRRARESAKEVAAKAIERQKYIDKEIRKRD